MENLGFVYISQFWVTAFQLLIGWDLLNSNQTECKQKIYKKKKLKFMKKIQSWTFWSIGGNTFTISYLGIKSDFNLCHWGMSFLFYVDFLWHKIVRINYFGNLFWRRLKYANLNLWQKYEWNNLSTNMKKVWRFIANQDTILLHWCFFR